MEIGVIAYCLRVVNDGWNLVSKTLSLRPKRVAQEIHDEVTFFRPSRPEEQEASAAR